MKIVVIGGDATGGSAASQAKRRLGDAAEIVMLEKQTWTSYSACGIPYWVADQVPDGPERLIARTPEQHRANGIDVRTSTEVTTIDLEAQVVTTRKVGPGGCDESFAYDHLVIATGATPAMPPIPGLDLPGVHRAHTLKDGLAAIDSLAHRPQHAVVLGAGYVGLEMAEAAIDRGLETRVIDLSKQPMRTLDSDMGALVREALQEFCVGVHVDEPATELLAGDDGRVRAVRTHKGEYPADIVFLGLGVQPRTVLAAAVGLPLGEHGGILTDDRQRVLGHENVWSGGDCTEVYDRIKDGRRYVPLGTHANHHGRVIGLNLAGDDARFPGIVGTSITKFRDTEVARTGAKVSEAEEWGMDVVHATIRSKTRAGYMPGATRITVRMIAERASGRVVGCQIVGGPGSGKRIDTAATAIWNRMTAAEMLDLDLAYAPPFSPVWDPVAMAARQLAALLHPQAGPFRRSHLPQTGG